MPHSLTLIPGLLKQRLSALFPELCGAKLEHNLSLLHTSALMGQGSSCKTYAFLAAKMRIKGTENYLRLTRTHGSVRKEVSQIKLTLGLVAMLSSSAYLVLDRNSNDQSP